MILKFTARGDTLEAKKFLRAAQDVRLRNGAALLVSSCSAVAFLFTRLQVHLSKQPEKPAFLLRWGPDLFFAPLALIVLVLVINVVRKPPPVTVTRQRSLFAETSDGGRILFDEADVTVASRDEQFVVQVGGQIRGPEHQRILKYFRVPFARAARPTDLPVQLLVSELSRTQGNFWWPQPKGTFKSDGSYEAIGYLGSTGAYSPSDGDMFELRLLIGTKRGGCLTEGDQMESLDDLPSYIFLSNPLIVRTRR
jgi:hypothetical protein